MKSNKNESVLSDLSQTEAEINELKKELAVVEEKLKPLYEAQDKVANHKQLLEQINTRYNYFSNLGRNFFYTQQYEEAKRLKNEAEITFKQSQQELSKITTELTKVIESKETITMRITMKEGLYETIKLGLMESNTYAAPVSVENIADNQIIQSEFEKRKPQLEQLLADKKSKQQQVISLYKSIEEYDSEIEALKKERDEAIILKRDLKRAIKLAKNMISFDDNAKEIKIDNLSVAAMKQQLELIQANYLHLKSRPWYIKLWDIISSFLSGSVTKKHEAKALYQQSKEEYDRFLAKINTELKDTDKAIKNFKVQIYHQKKAKEQVKLTLKQYDKLDNIREGINQLEDALAYDLNAAKEPLIKRCEPEIRLGVLVESQSANSVKKHLKAFLQTPSTHTFNTLETTLKSDVGQRALTNTDLVDLLTDVAEIYTDVSKLLPKEAFLTISADKMIQMLSDDIISREQERDALKEEKKELEHYLIENRSQVDDYDLRIKNNKTALLTGYFAIVAAKKSRELEGLDLKEKETLEQIITKLSEKTGTIKNNLPNQETKHFTEVFEDAAIEQQDFNSIFLMYYYPKDTKGFYAILNQYTPTYQPLAPPLSFKQIDMLKKELGERFKELSERLTSLPALRKAYVEDNLQEVLNFVHAAWQEEKQFYEAALEDTLHALDTLADDIENTNDGNTIALFNQLIDPMLKSNRTSLLEVKGIASTLLEEFKKNNTSFSAYPSLKQVKKALRRLTAHYNLCIENELAHETITPKEFDSATSFTKKENRFIEIEEKLKQLTEEIKSTRQQKQTIANTGQVNHKLRTDSINQLINACQRFTVQHSTVRVALKNFLSYPTPRLFVKLQEALENDPSSTNANKIGRLLTEAQALYPEIETIVRLAASKLSPHSSDDFNENAPPTP